MNDLDRMSAAIEKLTQRMAAMEQYISRVTSGNSQIEDILVMRYGEIVNKTTASIILGVTRATVYAMLNDGRILGACEGRRVNVRSIARYMARSMQSSAASA